MSNKNIRLIILLGALVIVGILIVQMYWVRQAFAMENKQLDQSVRIHLSRVSQALNQGPAADETVEQQASNYYVLQLNGKIDTSLLRSLMVKEFSSNQMTAQLEYGVYDSSTHKMMYGDIVAYEETGGPQLKDRSLPVLGKGEYYLGIYFPGVLMRMGGEMYIWIFSTVLMVIFLLFFVYAMFVILKQKRLSEIQRNFVNNMTHEFKTPLTTISLAAERLEYYPETHHPQIAGFIQLIKKETVRLNGHIDKILLASKSRSAKMHLKKENLNLHALIADAVQRIQPLVSGKRLLKLDLSAENPQVYADKGYLQDALQNLLENAVKYSGDNGQIVIRTETRANTLYLSVADNGIGIDQKYTRKIFEPFFRVPTGDVHNVRGFGIGLHYVKSIVNAHRWKLVLVSEQNRGSKFTLQIPA